MQFSLPDHAYMFTGELAAIASVFTAELAAIFQLAVEITRNVLQQKLIILLTPKVFYRPFGVTALKIHLFRK